MATNPPEVPEQEERLYTYTMKCVICVKTLGVQKHVLHRQCSGEYVRWSTVKANYTPCSEHPDHGFIVEWSPE